MKKTWHFIFSALAVTAMLINSTALIAGQSVTLVYTNSLNGNIDFCHCKADPNGGLVKRAAEISNIRAKYSNIILVDTGDFFTYEPDALLAEYLVKSFKYIGYDAIQFGDQEFTIGPDSFLKYKDMLPFVNNNLLIKKNGADEKPFRRYIVIEKGGIKIGIIGSISSDSFKYYSADLLEKIKISDQIKEINNDIVSLKKRKINLIILLSHSGYENEILLQNKLTGVDVIVGGHSQTLIKDPPDKRPLLVQAGTNGAHIGILELVLDKGKIKSFKNSFLWPNDSAPEDDKYIRKLINDYKAEADKKFKELRFK